MPRPRYLVGIDEAGRGALAGPVAVGAVLAQVGSPAFDIRHLPPLRDSKQLSPQERALWFAWLRQERQAGRLSFAVAMVGAEVIDGRGINFAIRMAVGRVLRQLVRGKISAQMSPTNCRIVLDGGLRAPESYLCQETIIRGDESEPIISLASIVAKVSRDLRICRFDSLYPNYDLKKHKGYGTRAHYRFLDRFGPSVIHRRSFLRDFR